MQTPGHLISATAEFAACMQNGHDDFERGFLKLRILANRDSAPVVDNGDAVILMYDHLDLGTVSGQRFVDTVIHDFPHEMV
ncbi:hypothetical protein D3C73_1578920 [compost metagenome]